MARGRIAHAITFGEDVTSLGNAAQQYPLGTMRMEETTLSLGVEVYRYILHSANSVATVAGGLAYRGVTIALPWKVTGAIGSGASGLAMGVYQSVVTDATYAWVKTKGYQSNLKKQAGTGMSWAKGLYLFSDPSTTANMKARVIKIAATTKVSGAEIRAMLQRNIGFAASTHSTTNTTGKAYIELE
jgi:hypothetical protein